MRVALAYRTHLFIYSAASSAAFLSWCLLPLSLTRSACYTAAAILQYPTPGLHPTQEGHSSPSASNIYGMKITISSCVY